MSCDCSRKLFQTPQKFKCVQVLTPIRLPRGSPSPLKRTPKRQRIYSQIIVQCDSEYNDIITKNSSSQTDDVQEMYCNNTYCNLFGQVIERLSTQDKSKCNEIIQLLQLLKDDKYPLENIAFLLFLETVRFFSCKYSSEMKQKDFGKQAINFIIQKFYIYGRSQKCKSN